MLQIHPLLRQEKMTKVSNLVFGRTIRCVPENSRTLHIVSVFTQHYDVISVGTLAQILHETYMQKKIFVKIHVSFVPTNVSAWVRGHQNFLHHRKAGLWELMIWPGYDDDLIKDTTIFETVTTLKYFFCVILKHLDRHRDNHWTRFRGKSPR